MMVVKDEVLVPDISQFQGYVNFSEMLTANVQDVILRAGYGASARNADKCFSDNYARAGSVRLNRGAYWFAYATSRQEAEKEAASCLEVLAGRPLELPLFYDQESEDIPQIMRLPCAEAFAAYIKKHSSYAVGFYSYTAWLRGLDMARLQASFPYIWLADYRKNYDKSLPRDMHQFTAEGKLPGVSTDVDLSRMITNIRQNQQPATQTDPCGLLAEILTELKKITDKIGG